MPKLKIRAKKARDRQKLQAIVRNRTLKEAAEEVYDIGAKGGKNADATARVLGSKMLKTVNSSILDAATDAGLSPTKIANGLKAMINGNINNRLAFDQKKFGIETLLKMGVGGGYAAIKTEDKRTVENYLIGIIIDDPKSTGTGKLESAQN